MNLSLTSQSKEGYLLIESKGSIETMDDLLAQSEMIYEEISKFSFKKILVYQPETHFLPDLIPFFNLVQNYMDNFPPEIKELQIAVVVDPAYKEVAYTWETLCQSRGLQYFVFTGVDNALNFLLEE